MLRPISRSLAGALLAALVLPSLALALAHLPLADVGGAGAPSAVPRPALDPTEVGVGVDPANWAMFPGGSVGLSAGPTGLPSGCSVFAEWFAWGLAGSGYARGYLNASSGSAVELTALPNATGNLTVEVTAMFVLYCPTATGNVSVDVNPQAEAFVALLPPLSAGDVAVTPDPVAPGRFARISWQVEGGASPYEVVVSFGDGSTATVTQAAPGAGAILHAYAAGEYDPSIAVTDARGDRENASGFAPVDAAPGLAVSLEPSTSVAEAGRSFRVNASVAGGLAPITVAWNVSGVAATESAAGEGGTSLEVTPTGPGTIVVAAEASDEIGESARASANLTVVAGPSLALAALDGGADAGRPLRLNGSVSGGVGPYAIGWTLLPDGPSGSVFAGAPGSFDLAAVPPSPGPLLVLVNVTDGLGGNGSAVFDVGTVGLPPEAALVAPSGPAEAGRPLPVALSIAEGTPPYAWVIGADPGLADASAPAGVVAEAGSVVWNGTPSAAGNLSLTARVVDGAGAEAETNLTVPVLAPLQLAVDVDNATGAADVVVYAHVTGGLPPYAITATLGAVGSSSFNLSAPGGYALRLSGAAPGFDTLDVALDDSGGASRNFATSLFVPALAATGTAGGGPAASEAPAAAWADAGGTLALGAILVGGLLYVRRRRARHPPVAGTAPALDLVRRSLQESDGIDEETLGLLAEEQGVDPLAVHDAVARWTRAGRIRREEDPLGGERLLWIARAGPVGGPPPVAEVRP